MAVVEIKHPLIQHKLTFLRDKNTNTKLFRETLNEIGGLMTYEATRNFPTEDIKVETPLMATTCQTLKDKVAVVPILRAGIGMVDGIVAFIPNAKIGHVGVYRDEETLEPVYYYCKLPVDIKESKVLLVDPMLATGGSAIYAIDYLKEAGVTDITFMCLVAAPEGIEKVVKKHPDVDIYAAQIDTGLDENGYIYPGLGDCGDRIFGTK